MHGSEKRRFWTKMIWISVGGIVIPPLIGLAAAVVKKMIRGFGTLPQNGSDVAALEAHISSVLVSTVVVMIISGLAFVFLLISLGRFFSLPKPTFESVNIHFNGAPVSPPARSE
ncbi:MAG: hypothetical protein QM680_08670 [Luteolibacter sp.]